MRTKVTVLAASLAVGALSGLAHGQPCTQVFGPIDVEAATGSNGCLGVAFLDGQYYVSARDPSGAATAHVVGIFDYSGNYLSSFAWAGTAGTSTWGYRDGTSDGTYLYFGWEQGLARHNADGSGGTVIVNGAAPGGVGTWRALAYDADGDGGNGSFWVANFSSAIVEVSMTGALLTTLPNDGWSLYGLALDPANPDFLYGHTSDGLTEPQIWQINKTTGNFTGLICTTDQPAEVQGGLSGVPGGCEGTGNDWDLVAIIQKAPDTMKGFQRPGTSELVILDGPGFDPWYFTPPVFPPPAPPVPWKPGFIGDWHELVPNYCTWYDTAGFEDVGVGNEGYLGVCDNILLQELDELGEPVGTPEWWHIDDITITVLIELFSGGGQRYLEWAGELEPFPPASWQGLWIEAYPSTGVEVMVDLVTTIDPPGPEGDYFTIGPDIYVVIEVAVDIIVSQEVPDFGACCVDYECVATTSLEECTVMGGDWYGGETCPEFPCPQPPSGACCIMEICEFTGTVEECATAGGMWYEGETCPAFQCPAGCLHTICLSDDFGDGWNGGMIDVSVNSVLIFDDLTLLTGTGPECHTFLASTGDLIDVVYTPGSWAYENEYWILDGNGVEIFRDGAGGVEPTGGSTTGNCEPVYGACCVEGLCVATTTPAECDDLGGLWFQDETCPEFECPQSRTIWATNHFGTPTDTIITFDSFNPSVITTIGPTNVADGMGGLDFDADGNLWGHTSFGDVGAVLGLYSIDKSTGAATVQGTLNNIGIGDLAFNPTDGQMYGVVFQPVEIYTIDLVTGAATLQGTVTTPAGMAVTGLACDSFGVLYIQDVATNAIYSVSADLTTGTLCHTSPFVANYSQGMTIDWSQGDAGYHGAYNATVSDGQLWAFDTGCTSYVLRGPINLTGDEVGDVACEPGGCVEDPDANGDGCVDVLDLLDVIANWGSAGPYADVNCDGVVDVLDLLAVIAAWGQGCP